MNSTKKVLNKICLSVFITLITLAQNKVWSYDLPVFYRAPMTQDNITKDIKSWASTFKVGYAHASTSKAWDGHSKSAKLLDVYGNLDLTKLGWWIDTPGDLTNTYWGPSSASTDPNNIPPGSTTQNAIDGKISFSGHVKVDEANLYFQQNIVHGLFVSVYAPYRKTIIDKISSKNLGKDTIYIKKKGETTYPHSVDIKTILSKLNDILKENKYKTNYNAPTKKQGIPEVQLNLGWQGYDNKSFGIVDSLAGTIQAGVLIPCGHEIDTSKPFDIPIGFNNFWGFSGLASGEVTIWKYLGLGAWVNANIFLRNDRMIRMRTDEDQSGWFNLEQTWANIDPASTWNFGIYGKVEPLSGVSCIAGYSMNVQETTTLRVKDDNFLKTRANAELKDTYPKVLSRDSVVNTEDRLRAWHQHTFHAALRIDAGKLCPSVSPLLEVEYDYPFYGQRSFQADTITGIAGIRLSFNF